MTQTLQDQDPHLAHNSVFQLYLDLKGGRRTAAASDPQADLGLVATEVTRWPFFPLPTDSTLAGRRQQWKEGFTSAPHALPVIKDSACLPVLVELNTRNTHVSG